MLSRNEKRVHIILTITVDMYLYLVSTPAQPWQVHDTTLATIITSLLTILFTNGSQTNVDIAAQKLKVNLAYWHISKHYRRLLVLWKGTCAPKAQKPVTLP